VIGCSAQTRDKACSAGVVIRVSPMGVRAHDRLSNAEGLLVQRRICIRQIEFCATDVNGKANTFKRVGALRRARRTSNLSEQLGPTDVYDASLRGRLL